MIAALVIGVVILVWRLSSGAPAGIGDRSEFTRNSCLASGSGHQTVFVDAGHGGLDSGTHGTLSSGATITEKTAALATALKVRDLLVEDGYRVVLSRTTDGTVADIPSSEITGTTYTAAGDHRDIRARVDCANASGAAVMVSIHFNAFDDPSIGGVTTYYDRDRSFAARNKRLARAVQDGILSSFADAGLTAIPDRGIVPDDQGAGGAISREAQAYGHLYLLGPFKRGFNDEPSRMPGVLTEPLFLSDPPEAALAASPHGRVLVARGIVTGVERYLRSDSR